MENCVCMCFAECVVFIETVHQMRAEELSLGCVVVFINFFLFFIQRSCLERVRFIPVYNVLARISLRCAFFFLTPNGWQCVIQLRKLHVPCMWWKKKINGKTCPLRYQSVYTSKIRNFKGLPRQQRKKTTTMKKYAHVCMLRGWWIFFLQRASNDYIANCYVPWDKASILTHAHFLPFSLWIVGLLFYLFLFSVFRSSGLNL